MDYWDGDVPVANYKNPRVVNYKNSASSIIRISRVAK